MDDYLTTHGEYEQWMVPAWCPHEQRLHEYFTTLHHSSITTMFFKMFANQLAIDFVLVMIDDLRRLMARYEHWWHHYATLHPDSMAWCDWGITGSLYYIMCFVS